jgi:hypothetical protein
MGCFLFTTGAIVLEANPLIFDSLTVVLLLFRFSVNVSNTSFTSFTVVALSKFSSTLFNLSRFKAPPD